MVVLAGTEVVYSRERKIRRESQEAEAERQRGRAGSKSWRQWKDVLFSFMRCCKATFHGRWREGRNWGLAVRQTGQGLTLTLVITPSRLLLVCSYCYSCKVSLPPQIAQCTATFLYYLSSGIPSVASAQHGAVSGILVL